MKYIGEIFSLAAALGWVGSSVFFEKASKNHDSESLNVSRLGVSLFILGTIGFFTNGTFVPKISINSSLSFLVLSGFFGLFLGDIFLYSAYKMVGARISLLIMTLSPLVVALLGFVLFGENMNLIQVAAMFLTCAGILAVVTKNSGKNEEKNSDFSSKGLLFAVLAMMGQSIGMILTKAGIGDYDPIAVTQIRFLAALGVFIFYLTFKQDWKKVYNFFADRNALTNMILGSLAATAGVTSLVQAMNLTHIGIASTLSSISPILVIPFSIILFKENVKLQEVAGTLVSVLGISLFFLA